MSNNILYTTCSVSFGPGSWDHNHRLITLEHVDSTRTKNNKFFNDETLEEGVQIVFGEAKTTFPATNEEPENQECYIDKLKRDGRIKLYMELVVMVGNEKTCGLGTAGWWTSQEILCEFAKRVVGKFKNLYAYCIVLHLDEETPHLHIMLLPFAANDREGVSKKWSWADALEAEGIPKGRNQVPKWTGVLKEKLEEIMLEYGVKWIPGLGLSRRHIQIEEYKAIMENAYTWILTLPEQIKRQFQFGNKVVVLKDELGDLEQRAKIEMVFVDNAKRAIEELNKELAEVKAYRKYLDAQCAEIEEERTRISGMPERIAELEYENRCLKQKVEELTCNCNEYQAEYEEERERTKKIERERNAKNEALKNYREMLAMMICPSGKLEIQNLDVEYRQLLWAAVREGKRTLRDKGVDVYSYSIRNEEQITERISEEHHVISVQEPEMEL